MKKFPGLSGKIKTVALASTVFCLYLAILPPILPFFLPCMQYRPGQPATVSGCPAVRILDVFIILALSGSAILSLYVFLKININKIVLTTLFIIIASLSTIISYYLYSPYANQVAAKAPIIIYDLQK